jgi:hypothetical protein
MIDWWSLAASAIWILGLALGLAAVSFAYWQAASRKAPGLKVHDTRTLRALLAGAGVLFSIGWGASSSETWERLAWCLLGVLLAIRLWRDWRDWGSRGP